jgi:hypothetical protein
MEDLANYLISYFKYREVSDFRHLNTGPFCCKVFGTVLALEFKVYLKN